MRNNAIILHNLDARRNEKINKIMSDSIVSIMNLILTELYNVTYEVDIWAAGWSSIKIISHLVSLSHQF